MRMLIYESWAHTLTYLWRALEAFMTNKVGVKSDRRAERTISPALASCCLKSRNKNRYHWFIAPWSAIIGSCCLAACSRYPLSEHCCLTRQSLSTNRNATLLSFTCWHVHYDVTSPLSWEIYHFYVVFATFTLHHKLFWNILLTMACKHKSSLLSCYCFHFSINLKALYS